MPKYLEWDYDNPKHRQRRSPPILEGEILTPEEEPTPRIRIKVTHRYSLRRQHNTIPPWLIALLIIAALMWVSPFGAVVAIVMASVLIASHPAIAFVIGGMIALVAIAAIRERRAGRPF
jgi:hypothetical protein